MRTSAAWLGVALLAIGCRPPDEGDDGETDGTAGTGDAATMTAADDGPDSTAGADATDGVDDTGDESTGGVPGDALVPCDPRDGDTACDEGACSGSGVAGYYCRPACSDTAEPGTPCGADDVCLPALDDADALVCYDVSGCDLVTGDGCAIGAGDSCVVVDHEPLTTTCVPAGGAGVGDSCGPAGGQACGVGLACFGSDLDGDDPGACGGWCAPGDPLPAACELCVPLTAEIGSCAQCSVLQQDCRDGSACQPINEALGGVCVPHGDGGPGEPCSFAPDGACAPGHLCLETEVDDAFACVPTCDPGAPMCEGGTSCVDLGLLVPGARTGLLGVCIATDMPLCDPDARPTGCPRGQQCLPTGGDFGICVAPCDPTEGDGACEQANAACLPIEDGEFDSEPFVEGNGACGAACSGDGDCGGGTCLLLDGLDVDGVCGTTCNPAGGGCGGGQTCVATPGDADVGACIAGGAACDPDVIGGCPGPGLACVELDGGGEATCMPLCFVQDPAACAGMPALCRVKTDPTWHEGVCIDGGDDPCDPIAQDCPPDRACRVIGGGPIGGIAYLCDDTGPLQAGEDCMGMDTACGPGLACFDDVCTTFCDPTADACAMGTCTDVSARFYLPADTLGVCQ